MNHFAGLYSFRNSFLHFQGRSEQVISRMNLEKLQVAREYEKSKKPSAILTRGSVAASNNVGYDLCRIQEN